MSSPGKKMKKARAGLVLDHPFFGSLALRLKPVPDPECQGMWTDGVYLGFNPEWVANAPLEEVKGLMAHEVMHLALDHHAREGNRDHRTWNEACDYAINLILLDAGLALPRGLLLDNRFRGMCAEEIYPLLLREKSDADGRGSAAGGGGGRQPGQGKGDGDRQADAPPSPALVGEVRPSPNPNDSVRAAEWKTAVAQAAAQAKAMGRLPAGLDRMVREAIEPRMDWREILQRFADENARNDYSWFPPNRRYIHMGLILPSLRSQELLRPVAVLDTSGSISQSLLDDLATKLSGILESYPGAELMVIYNDSQVAGVEKFTAQDLPLQLHPRGGGGTDFRPPFQYLDEHGIRPTCLVYFTDGICNLFPEEPTYPVLWAGTRDFTPPFGEFVRVLE